jgi:hypothetical protein
MGDRANIAVRFDPIEGHPAPRVYLYGHWSGVVPPSVREPGKDVTQCGDVTQ